MSVLYQKMSYHHSITVKVKNILFFVSFSFSLSFAQTYQKGIALTNVPPDSLIQGNWYLTQTAIFDSYNIYSDSNKFTLEERANREITITADSLILPRDNSLRYYIRQQNYTYQIEFDSLVSVYNLKLLTGKRKKIREVASYEIIKCSTEELVIKSYQFLHNGLDYSSFSIVYTYRRKGVRNLFEEIKGD